MAASEWPPLGIQHIHQFERTRGQLVDGLEELAAEVLGDAHVVERLTSEEQQGGVVDLVLFEHGAIAVGALVAQKCDDALVLPPCADLVGEEEAVGVLSGARLQTELVLGGTVRTN